MKPLLLHGPAIEASRRKLQEIKKKFSAKGGPASGWDPDNVVVFEKDEEVGVILTNLKAQSLFEGERLVIIENPPEDLSLDLSLITYHLSLILWFDHEVDIKKWPGFEYHFFPESRDVSVFPFLDYLVAKDKKAFLEIEKLKSVGFDIHYLLTMTFYLLRKSAKQRTGFSLENLTTLYKYLLEIDFKIKSGNLEKSQAEFLLTTKFLGH